MRGRYRTRQTVYAARPLPVSDGLGGVSEGFSASRVSFSAQIVPAAGDLLAAAPGVKATQSLMLLFAPFADVRPGDGIYLPGDQAPSCRCVRVERYPLHQRALIERRQA